MEPCRGVHHRGPGRAGIPFLVSGPPRTRPAGEGLQRLSFHLSGRRNRPDLAAAAHRDLLAKVRRPALRDPTDKPMAAHRPDAPLRERLRGPGGRPGRAGVRLPKSQPQPVRRRSARKLPQALFGDRPGSASADDPRGVDADLVLGARAARTRLRGRSRLLRLPSLSRRHDQVPPVEHGPGGRFALPADRAAAGYRSDCPAATAAERIFAACVSLRPPSSSSRPR